MSKKIAAIVALTVCLGVGFVTGGEWEERRRADLDAARDSDATENATNSSASGNAAPAEVDIPGVETQEELIARARRATELESENSKLTSELEELRGLVSALEQQMPRTAGPVFTFGEAGQLDGVHGANWTEMADASVEVQNAILEIEAYQERGETPPKDLLVALQQNVEKLRKYEYATLGQLPTSAKYNGETTHPITTSNLVASVLREAGLDLDESQIERVARLGESYERAYSRMQGQYGEDTLRVQRILDEYALKGKFTDDLFGVMSSEQQNAIVPDAFRGIAKMDLHDPTLMIIHTSPVIVGQNANEIRTKTSQALTQQFGIPDSMSEVVTQSVNMWFDEFEGELEVAPKSRLDNYSYADGALAGSATIALFETLSAHPNLPAEVRSKIADFPGFFVPRLVEPADSESP